MKTITLNAGLLAALLLGAGPAWAQVYQSQGSINTIAATFSPTPREDQQHVDDFDHLNLAAARLPDRIEAESRVNNGGFSRGIVEGSIGHLKAFAEASYPSGIPVPHYNGYAGATARATFADTVAVGGAGLALGTPVSYELRFYIEGERTTPVFESGGYLSVEGLAELRLRDLNSGADSWISWDAKRQANGWYSVNVNTQVGHSLMVSGMLYAGASVSASATLGRYAMSDYGHSASYFLAPSVQGLNVIGASGHDFTVSAVPEPATALLFLAGGLLVIARRRH